MKMLIVLCKEFYARAYFIESGLGLYLAINVFLDILKGFRGQRVELSHKFLAGSWNDSTEMSRGTKPKNRPTSNKLLYPLDNFF